MACKHQWINRKSLPYTRRWNPKGWLQVWTGLLAAGTYNATESMWTKISNCITAENHFWHQLEWLKVIDLTQTHTNQRHTKLSFGLWNAEEPLFRRKSDRLVCKPTDLWSKAIKFLKIGRQTFTIDACTCLNNKCRKGNKFSKKKGQLGRPCGLPVCVCAGLFPPQLVVVLGFSLSGKLPVRIEPAFGLKPNSMKWFLKNRSKSTERPLAPKPSFGRSTKAFHHRPFSETNGRPCLRIDCSGLFPFQCSFPLMHKRVREFKCDHFPHMCRA